MGIQKARAHSNVCLWFVPPLWSLTFLLSEVLSLCFYLAFDSLARGGRPGLRSPRVVPLLLPGFWTLGFLGALGALWLQTRLILLLCDLASMQGRGECLLHLHLPIMLLSFFSPFCLLCFDSLSSSESSDALGEANPTALYWSSLVTSFMSPEILGT